MSIEQHDVFDAFCLLEIGAVGEEDAVPWGLPNARTWRSRSVAARSLTVARPLATSSSSSKTRRPGIGSGGRNSTPYSQSRSSSVGGPSAADFYGCVAMTAMAARAAAARQRCLFLVTCRTARVDGTACAVPWSFASCRP